MAGGAGAGKQPGASFHTGLTLRFRQLALEHVDALGKRRLVPTRGGEGNPDGRDQQGDADAQDRRS